MPNRKPKPKPRRPPPAPRPDIVDRWRKGVRYYWHRKSANGKIVSQAGPFMTSWGALRNARKVNSDLEVE